MPVNRGQGCLLGQLAGDALGSLVEFQTPEEIRCGNHTLNHVFSLPEKTERYLPVRTPATIHNTTQSVRFFSEKLISAYFCLSIS